MLGRPKPEVQDTFRFFAVVGVRLLLDVTQLGRPRQTKLLRHRRREKNVKRIQESMGTQVNMIDLPINTSDSLARLFVGIGVLVGVAQLGRPRQTKFRQYPRQEENV